jgi:non-specific serine/threonine protein kinase/serine/threonine-protein kinase
MTVERWAQVKEVLYAVLELEPAQRSAYLDRVCVNDPLLRQEVESFILSHSQLDTDFLKTISLEGANFQASEATHSLVGRSIGPYRIVEEIGVGGMGEVYRAVRADDQYKKEVAIKVVRRGFDTDSGLRRFKAERQILASLDHPNIARLLDSGSTEDGLPYVVMELVEGKPIDEYCDGHNLSLIERLQLFRMVCAAVQYAHQHLVVHRDLKPGNILVTEEGVPKLLDFGIAKLLSPEMFAQPLDRTATLMRVMTPDFASPEQVRGELITTASDVYSLGVVLYRLLTGCSPYKITSEAPHEIAREICESEPPRPSVAITRVEEPVGSDRAPGQMTSPVHSRAQETRRLRRRLAGDLDNIVLMALRKEPQRRYASVAQFSDDIRRHLENIPVIARGDNARYRTAKFISRHKTGFAAALAVAVTLLVGIAVTLREAHVARVERVRAEQRFKDVRELANSDLFELHDAIEQLPGSAPVRNRVIQRALKYLSKLSQDAAGDRELMRELAAGYERIAHLQGNFSGPEIGDSKAALDSFQKAVAIREQLVTSSHRDANELQAEGSLLRAYVACLLKTRRTGEAAEVAQHALSIADEILRKRPHDVQAIADNARANSTLADVIGGDGSTPSTREIPEAIRHDRKASTLYKEILAASPSVNTQKALFLSQMRLAFHLSRAREFDEASRALEDLSPDQQPPTVAKETSGSPDRQGPLFAPDPFSLYIFYDRRGLMYERQSDPQKALADYQRTLRITRSSVKADPRNLLAQVAFDIANAKVGMQEVRLGNKAAGKDVGIAVEACERLLMANPSESFYESLLVVGYSYQGETLSAFGNQPAAQKKYSDALAMATLLRQENPQDLDSLLSIAKTHDSLGVVLTRGTRYDQARQEFAAARNSSEELLRIRPQDTEALYLSGLIHEHLALIETCSRRRACGNIAQWRLPNPTN